MQFDEIVGQEHIKQHLKTSVDNGRIPHAQLFIGKEGCGTLPMAIAYAQYVLCKFAPDVESCKIKCEKLQHPDLHFAFPVTTTDTVKKNPVSNLFLEDWRNFIQQQPYGGLFNWLQAIGIENKQGIIGVDEADDIVKKLLLKSYEGGFKVMLIWMAEKMNTQAANKLLKLIEEPPAKTVFILITEDEEQIINTIKSRCQAIHFPKLSTKDMTHFIEHKFAVSHTDAQFIAHQADGNLNKAIHLTNNNDNDALFENWFVSWVRLAFSAKTNVSVLPEIINWADAIAATGRETQKQFLNYCLYFFRQALLQNFQTSNLVYLQTKSGFDLKKFAPFVNSANILEINQELNDALYHIERNGNAKVILLDLSLKLTRLLHKKEEKVLRIKN